MIAIISCSGNNIASIQCALERIGEKSVLTCDPAIITTASHVILPGVGQAKYAMNKLQQHNLIEVIKNLTQPVLGICLGMQLLYESSAEGDVPCLGIIPGKVSQLPQNNHDIIPHMGWNTLNDIPDNEPITQGINLNPFTYFVHSYYAPINQWTIATTTHATKFTAMVKYKNFYGMQFHPEKSGKIGEKLLANFINGETNEYNSSN